MGFQANTKNRTTAAEVCNRLQPRWGGITVGIISKNRRALTRGISATAMAAASLFAAGAVMMPTMASAQVSTASLSGQVTSADGAAAAGAPVTARSTATNQTVRAVAGSDGAYVLNGLRPGQYEVSATIGTETITQTVIVGVGEAASL